MTTPTTQTAAPEATGESSTTHTIRLRGCAPTPLVNYLKALAILRLVADQADPDARGHWLDDDFVLESRLDSDALIDFFLHTYEPTPIASPWNGGSGFKPKKIRSEVSALRHSEASRLENYRNTIEAAFELLDDMGIEGKVPKKRKEPFLCACRARFPESALAWLDATYVLTGEGASYPAVLGSGGNDGRLEFGLNFMSRLERLFDYETGTPASDVGSLLGASLFNAPHHNLQTGDAIGQFFPRAVGGTNQTTGFSADTVSNPWDYVLMLEGAVFFAAAAVKRLENARSASMSVPFSVRHVGVGQGSADTSEESDARDELWIPLWEEAATARELDALMSEGRARIGRRTVRDGIEFARAVATLGVDRGITEFHRYGFQQRNGRAYFATPLNRIAVTNSPHVELIDDIDGWFNRITNTVRYGDNVPGRIESAVRNLEEAVFRLCELDTTSRVLDVVTCLGACERQLATSHEWVKQSGIRPLSGLSPNWFNAADDGSPEFRLAASLASVYGNYGGTFSSVRSQLEPVDRRSRRYLWREQKGPDVVWHDGDPVDVLAQIMNRRILQAVESTTDTWPDTGRIKASLADVALFLDGLVDASRLTEIAWGLIGVDWPRVSGDPVDLPEPEDIHPGALFALTKLCFSGITKRKTDGEPEDDTPTGDELADVRLVPAIHRHLLNGAGDRASIAAARRLRADNLRPAIDRVNTSGEPVRRCAAGLIFPLRRRDLYQLQNLILKPADPR